MSYYTSHNFELDYGGFVDLQEGDTLRPNDDGTVTLITASGGEHTYDPELVFRDVNKEAE